MAAFGRKSGDLTVEILRASSPHLPLIPRTLREKGKGAITLDRWVARAQTPPRMEVAIAQASQIQGSKHLVRGSG